MFQSLPPPFLARLAACAVAMLAFVAPKAAESQTVPASSPFGTGPSTVSAPLGPVPSGPSTIVQPIAQPFGSPDAADTTGAYASKIAYTLRPGDVISINVYGEPTLSEAQTRVTPDGSVALPLVGLVHVGGKTSSGAGVAIDTALRRYLRSPRTIVSLLQIAPLQVLVLGAVRAPNKYVLQPQSGLIDAIAAAGGLNPTDGAFPDARIQTGTSAIQTIPLQRLYHDGDMSYNVPLRSGMTIYVPSPNLFQVQVAGAVDHSGDITVREGDRLSMAIARAGVSASSNADLNRITFRRVQPNGTVDSQIIDLYAVLKSNDVSKDPILAKDDYIAVPKARSSGGAANFLYPLLNLAPRL